MYVCMYVCMFFISDCCASLHLVSCKMCWALRKEKNDGKPKLYRDVMKIRLHSGVINKSRMDKRPKFIRQIWCKSKPLIH